MAIPKPKLRNDGKCELCKKDIGRANGICARCGINLCSDCYRQHNSVVCANWGRELGVSA